jgi:hypothetical protein
MDFPMSGIVCVFSVTKLIFGALVDAATKQASGIDMTGIFASDHNSARIGR